MTDNSEKTENQPLSQTLRRLHAPYKTQKVVLLLSQTKAEDHKKLLKQNLRDEKK